MSESGHGVRRLFLAALSLVVLAAAALRLYDLPGIPLGLHYDEAANGILASGIASGNNYPLFITAYTGKEVLFFYWAALCMKVLGATSLALRLSSSLVGIATVAAAVWMTRELFHDLPDSRWIALLTGAFLGTSLWHLILSRYGFRAITQPLLQALTIAALWHGLRLSPDQKALARQRTFWILLAGTLCGLTGYTYLAARAFPFPLGAGLLGFVLSDTGHRRARLRQIGIFVLVALVVVMPEAAYWVSQPGTFLNRTQQVAARSWQEVWSGIRACLAMFFVRGDPYIRFNIPYRPIFGPAGAILFILGLFYVLWKSIPFQKQSHTLDPSQCLGSG